MNGIFKLACAAALAAVAEMSLLAHDADAGLFGRRGGGGNCTSSSGCQLNSASVSAAAASAATPQAPLPLPAASSAATAVAPGAVVIPQAAVTCPDCAKADVKVESQAVAPLVVSPMSIAAFVQPTYVYAQPAYVMAQPLVALGAPATASASASSSGAASTTTYAPRPLAAGLAAYRASRAEKAAVRAARRAGANSSVSIAIARGGY